MDPKELIEAAEAKAKKIALVSNEVKKIMVGQEYVLNRLLLGLLSNGHVLLEGLPGLAKTLMVRTLAQSTKCDFKRIQFTPDLLPSDLIGTKIYNQKTSEFVTKKGPIFTNFLLTDEINRAPPKVQSALLEAMQEQRATIGGDTYSLPRPFLVLATQNPIETEGTYPLPEAQIDRFMFKVNVVYPNKKEEIEIIERMASVREVELNPVLSPEEIVKLQDLTRRVHVDDKIKEYIVNIVLASRNPKEYGLDLQGIIQYGASPRASIFLTLGAKANALLNGKGYVTPDDVKEVAPDVLRHRLILTYEAQAEEITQQSIIDDILKKIEVP